MNDRYWQGYTEGLDKGEKLAQSDVKAAWMFSFILGMVAGACLILVCMVLRT